MTKIRLDELLVSLSLVTTRSQARHLIKDKAVLVNSQPAQKPGQLTSPNANIEITRDLYVSRGAYKLLAALEEFQINPENKTCADIGASTGGFTEVLLEKGAQKIYAIDVGHSQLVEHLKSNPKVINLEKTNIRSLEKLPELADLAVIDLSFISLRIVLKSIFKLLKPTGKIIALFKPQFETQNQEKPENNILSPQKSQQIFQEFLTWCKTENLKIKNHCPSPIKGKKGNQEFLVLINL